MKRLDLGKLRGPGLFFGGPYSNLQASQALKEYAEHHGISPSNIICSGDTVAYCAQPNETVELLRHWGVAVVQGNCEQSLANEVPHCGCGFEQGSACEALAQSWYRFADQNIEYRHRQWMRGLPGIIQFSILEKQFAVIHGGVDSINQFIFPSTNTDAKLQAILAAGVDGIIAGHCGLPFTQLIRHKLWHNPGAIGLPANDGTSRVWFSRWDIENRNIIIQHRSLEYDATLARANMLQVGLGNGYAEALISGLWPSQDVLPAEEKARQGRALSEHSFIFGVTQGANKHRFGGQVFQ
jgi:predicted phosphodiesterase